MSDVVAEFEGEVSEGIVEAIEDAAERDTSKHKRLVVEIDGVQCERIWGYAYFPSAQVREFTQYCRDTDRKINDLIAPIISGGVADLFDNEINPTAAEREDARKTKLPNSEEAILKAETKLLAQQEKIAAQLAAVKARAAALRAQTEPTPEVAAVLGNGNGKHGKRH